jgi:hypothetical protein
LFVERLFAAERMLSRPEKAAELVIPRAFQAL